MLVPFENLAENSKIWIYQSDRTLNEVEQKVIIENTESFLIEWTAHGNALQAGIQIFHDQFIIIGVNEDVNEASGCSIDKSVNHIRELGKALNIDMLQRSKIAIKNKDTIHMIDFPEIKKAIAGGLISKETEVFNNAITTKMDMKSSWVQPAAESWVKRYF